ncbi:MAG: hypothetical protein ACXVJO_04215, partial [Thermoanaerobaculia bacterium]
MGLSGAMAGHEPTDDEKGATDKQQSHFQGNVVSREADKQANRQDDQTDHLKEPSEDCAHPC